jgi:acetoin utilization deacetylase AcuC-like enzyme
MSTGIVYHSDYLRHDTGVGHPERADRLTSIIDLLEKEEVLERLRKILPMRAYKEVEYVHERGYIDHVRSTCERGGWLDMDTPVCKDSYEIAFLAAGGLISAVDAVMDEMKNAFATIRPPGHHASSNKGAGFCIFNNIAIAASHLEKRYELNRILIIDWDVHHGNGTEETFYADPSVLYFSTHQSPYYPGTGRVNDVGTGEGKGYNVNVPLPAGTGDLGYLYVLENILMPIALDFRPEFVLVSFGSDTHHADPLANMNVTSNGFGSFTRLASDIAEKTCDGRLVIALEGGYDLRALAYSVLYTFNVLADLGMEIDEPYPVPKDRLSDGVKRRVTEVKDAQRNYWEV